MNNNTAPPRRFRLSIGVCDAMFALLFAGAVSLLARNGFDHPSLGEVQAAVVAADPWLSLAIIVPAIPIMALIFALSTKVDRRCAEDYVFQLVANASLVAATGAIFVYVVWDLASGFLGGLR
ncbi:MAG: hypothetical protein LC634_04625, partial [Sphingomonadales bacterium]|nr:hypothetical protein [Sphingomonadales bacterium]